MGSRRLEVIDGGREPMWFVVMKREGEEEKDNGCLNRDYKSVETLC